MKIEYARKYNSKYKFKNREWKTCHFSNRISPTDWQLFDIKMDGVIYTSPSQEFLTKYEQIKMWSKLSDH